MTNLLSEFLVVGLLGQINDDVVLEKIDRAIKTLTESLRTQTNDLMRALLAGLDPDIPVVDPSIEKAKQALLAEWRTMLAAYPDEPIGLYRAALLEACNQCAEGMNAVVLWLVAADSLGFYRLGKEEKVVREFFQELGRKAERSIVAGLAIVDRSDSPIQESSDESEGTELSIGIAQVDRDHLQNKLAAATGPNYRSNSPISGANPQWSNSAGSWSWDFTDRMTKILADELDNLAEQVYQSQEAFAEHMKTSRQTQRQAIQAAITDHEHHRRAEQLRLDALWWSEALYSPGLGQSYRELMPEVAALVMVQDLLQVVSLPTPASVAHLLAETVQHLPNAGYEIKKPIGEWLEQLRQCTDKPDMEFSAVPKYGRLSLRDVFAWAVSDQYWDTAKAMQRAGIEATHEISLPALARALFRQEQACRLASAAS
jgi:GTPase-associated system helical domain